ncbi:rhodanese-like domain-containing protein [Dokdonia donghaensis]|uniref:Rhodanese n=1 Tax=Dokdonia donghaensis DSW-1 TaxID=1300343 RepID=A0A0A2GWH8_9FLAO|nr:rhodanese-like domain-containing protein [Dokdonia donghaensis]ANH60362.1 putative adenylyltransferase/sulfurtransferase MoeZ [Dokdonia donghaensis DSW-1]KGO07639.1 rhodanese [Dokdonia donghaensis DSW-1]
MKDLTIPEWEEKIAQDKDAVILDVRTEEETENGIIEGAKVIDIYQGQGFIDEVEKLDKDKNYYVYCRSGARSAQACALMGQLGFETTYNLLGGYMAWSEND